MLNSLFSVFSKFYSGRWIRFRLTETKPHSFKHGLNFKFQIRLACFKAQNNFLSSWTLCGAFTLLQHKNISCIDAIAASNWAMFISYCTSKYRETYSWILRFLVISVLCGHSISWLLVFSLTSKIYIILWLTFIHPSFKAYHKYLLSGWLTASLIDVGSSSDSPHVKAKVTRRTSNCRFWFTH